MDSILKRLATSGMAFQASSLLAGLLALFTLPLYTRSLTAAEFGYAETLLTLVILTSILLRAGLGEAFIRHWHDAGGDDARDGGRQAVRRAPTSRVGSRVVVAPLQSYQQCVS
jgi:hypothetical protein